MNEKTEKIKKIRNLLLAGGCVITAIICRHLPTNRESGWVAFFQLTRAYLYITLYCVWGISLQRRIVNKTARRCLCGIASLMVFWFVIRTLKYNVFYEPVLRRYRWYGYYVPLLSIPSLSVIAALKMRESENQKRRQWTGIFLVITVGVILLVMTNDLHQLVFRWRGLPQRLLLSSRKRQDLLLQARPRGVPHLLQPRDPESYRQRYSLGGSSKGYAQDQLRSLPQSPCA